MEESFFKNQASFHDYFYYFLRFDPGQPFVWTIPFSIANPELCPPSDL